MNVRDSGHRDGKKGREKGGMNGRPGQNLGRSLLVTGGCHCPPRQSWPVQPGGAVAAVSRRRKPGSQRPGSRRVPGTGSLRRPSAYVTARARAPAALPGGDRDLPVAGTTGH